MHQNKSFFSVVVLSNPIWKALLIQLIIFGCISFGLSHLMTWFPALFTSSISSILSNGFVWVGLQASLAVLLTFLMRLPKWWLWIQAIFPFALWLGLTQTLVPDWGFGIIAVLLLLIFSNVWRERVPLYLSNGNTELAMVQFAQENHINSAVDLGSGLGGVVRALAKSGVETKGVEASPILVILSNLLGRAEPLAKVIKGDIWHTDISQVDLVYVFLSPIPMPDIWRKACAEMKAGSWLVSNSFPIPDLEPEEIWELSDKRQTQLWIYRIPLPNTIDQPSINARNLP